MNNKFYVDDKGLHLVDESKLLSNDNLEKFIEDNKNMLHLLVPINNTVLGIFNNQYERNKLIDIPDNYEIIEFNDKLILNVKKL